MIHFAAPHPSLTVLSTIYLWSAGVELSGTQETRYCHDVPTPFNASGHVPCLGSYRHSPSCFLWPWLTSQCFLLPTLFLCALWNLNSRTVAPPDILHAFQNIASMSCPLMILLPSHTCLRLGGREVTSLASVPLADHCSRVCGRPLESPPL